MDERLLNILLSASRRVIKSYRTGLPRAMHLDIEALDEVVREFEAIEASAEKLEKWSKQELD